MTDRAESGVERNRLRQKARSRALAELAKAHPDEFDNLYQGELQLLGVDGVRWTYLGLEGLPAQNPHHSTQPRNRITP